MRLFAGSGHRFCDQVSRRSFLQIGSLAVGGLSLPQLLQADQKQGKGNSHKAVIMVYLSGGLSHQDSFDLKPAAPAEIRGEFSPIPSSVPGFDVCELLPKLAGVMDRCAVIRSVVGQRDTQWVKPSRIGTRILVRWLPKFRDRQILSSRRLSTFFQRCSTDPITAPVQDIWEVLISRCGPTEKTWPV